METEITIAQLRHCGVSVPVSVSLGEFTAVSLYELLIAALKRLRLIQAEGTNEKFPMSLTEADTAARLHYLSILTSKLQETGCNFVEDEHLTYPTESSTRRILIWVVAKFHEPAAVLNMDDKKCKNSPIGQALVSFQSLVRSYKQCREDKIREGAYIYPTTPVSTLRRPFCTVRVCKPEERDSNIPRWGQIEKGFKSMCVCTSPTPEKKVRQPRLSEAFLYSFQECNAVDRTYDNDFVHHVRKLLASKKKTHNNRSLIIAPLNCKAAGPSALPLRSTHLRSSASASDALFYNPSDECAVMEDVTTSGGSSINAHGEKMVHALQTSIGDAEEHRVGERKATLTQNEDSILSNYNGAKKERWELRNTLSDLTGKKMRFEDELQNLNYSMERQENEWKQSKKERKRLEEILSLMGDAKGSETEIQKEIDEWIKLAESVRSEIMVKLQKVTNKRSDLMEELRAAGSYHEEELASMRQTVKEVRRRLHAKRQEMQKWQESNPVHVEGIDRLQSLRYICNMTSGVCGQQAQLAVVACDTVESSRRVEELECHLRLEFAWREGVVHDAAARAESGPVLKQLLIAIVGVREGYNALIRAIIQSGKLLIELHRMGDRVETLRAEVNACSTLKVENDVKELRKMNNMVHKCSQQQQEELLHRQ